MGYKQNRRKRNEEQNRSEQNSKKTNKNINNSLCQPPALPVFFCIVLLSNFLSPSPRRLLHLKEGGRGEKRERGKGGKVKMGTWQVSKRGIKGKGKEGVIGKKMGKRASGVLREKRGIGKEDTI